MQSILGNTRKTDITFHANGRIDISARVVKALSIQEGDVLDIMADEGEYYLYVRFHAPVVGRHEATCFPTNPRSNHFRAWSSRLCRFMLEQSGSVADSVPLGLGMPVILPCLGIALPIICKHILKS